MRVDSAKAECFKMLDERPQTKTATLMVEFGLTKGTVHCYRCYHKRLRKEQKRQEEEVTRDRRH